MTAAETATADRYSRFAELEARGYSPLYDDWCSGVSTDGEVLALLDTLPPARRQPVLFLAAARFVGAPLGDYGTFRPFVVAHWSAISQVMMRRTTQTNEAGRCAVLLPSLAAISADEGRPLALIEVGASAGACLYPDRYAYDYTPGRRLAPDGGSAVPPLACSTAGGVPLPAALPDVVWRAGIDLNPLDAGNDDDVRWLEALVWPEHAFRAERLRAALALIRADPPLLVRGDLNDEVEPLVERAPTDAVVVVFHSAVLAYLDPAGRARFRDTMQRLAGSRARPVHWLSHEGYGTLAGVAGAMEKAPGEADGRFVLQHNGTTVARTGPHGQSIEWL
ncbi:DUF2332 domain-containing protein [Arthrobacter agilis]|uniref:DUF2332 domain-containing protein n=1 Tax=Arthrobacter agilis TaxID=37921 RepID=UPI000B35DB55|nr:DUF2332 domain-containing protein [Arthrobacter agilis]OUM43037.1 hypothetical protein B8W74_07260 [Arthrobacter agilis]PPB45981.1 DUF2332 domain-containing protein [Arthrobacter agilis]TPV25519.1 DUF2332 domain-containing protein [Arthrobacter agilis]VDR33275.1 Uncharacterized protein conserved in bacteria (DUF2332) [Arthrobacter agilis]